MLEPYSLVERVVSPTTPLTTFSDESLAIEELVIDDLQEAHVGLQINVGLEQFGKHQKWGARETHIADSDTHGPQP